MFKKGNLSVIYDREYISISIYLLLCLSYIYVCVQIVEKSAINIMPSRGCSINSQIIHKNSFK